MVGGWSTTFLTQTLLGPADKMYKQLPKYTDDPFGLVFV